MKHIKCAFFIFLLSNAVCYSQMAGYVDTTFKCGYHSSGVINDMAYQTDGKIILVGHFRTYDNHICNGIARINSDLSIDMTFNEGGTGFTDGVGWGFEYVETVAVDEDDKIYVGGKLDSYNGHPLDCIIRLLPDGEFDTTFNPGSGIYGPLRNIYALETQYDGKLIIGGKFETYNGVDRNCIARINYDGSLDESFDPDIGPYLIFDNDIIYDMILQNDNKLIVAGAFSSWNGTGRQNIVRLNNDGSLDLSFDADIDYDYDSYLDYVLLTPDEKIITTGLIFDDPQVLRLMPENGHIDTTFNFTGGGHAQSMCLLPDGKLITASVGHIKIIQTNGTPDPSYNNIEYYANYYDGYINDILLTGDTSFIAAGQFYSIGNEYKQNIADINLHGSTNDIFNFGSGVVYPDFNDYFIKDSLIYICGQFDKIIDSEEGHCMAKIDFDGNCDFSFLEGDGFEGGVHGILVRDDKIFVVGSFDSYNGIAANNIIQLQMDWSVDDAFDIGVGPAYEDEEPYPYIREIVVQPDEKIIISGRFISFNGVEKNDIVRLNIDGTLDTSFDFGSGVDGSILDLALQSDGKILVAGNFDHVHGMSISSLVRLNTDGTVDLTFNDGSGVDDPYDDWIAKIVQMPDGRFYIGGEMSTYNGYYRSNVARIFPDGSLDLSFNANDTYDEGGYYGNYWDMVLQTDGKLIVSGSTDWDYHNFVKRLDENGEIDATFLQDAKIKPFLLMDSFNNLFLIHDFSSVQHYTMNGMAKLKNDSIICSIIYAEVDTTICSDIIYILPDGIAVDEPGVYFTYFSAITGCDSVIKTILNMLPAFEESNNFSICEGDSVQLISGEYVYDEGTFENTFTNIYGCDSNYITVVNFYISYDIIIEAEITEDSSVLLPDGSYTSEPGEYIFTYESIYGCDSIITVEVVPTNISGVDQSYSINLRPSVNNGEFDIVTENCAGNVSIKILDVQGSIIYNSEFILDKNQPIHIQLPEFSKGVYFLIAEFDQNKLSWNKFVIQ